MTTGERIKKRREMLDISVDAVAAELGKNRATVYRYENGYIDDIPVSIVSKLAEILRTTPAYLMGWVDDPNAPISSSNIDADQLLPRVQIFYKYYRLITYMLGINERWDSEGNVFLESLDGRYMDFRVIDRFKLFEFLMKEATCFVWRDGQPGVNDKYTFLDDHGRAVVDAVIKLEYERADEDRARRLEELLKDVSEQT